MKLSSVSRAAPWPNTAPRPSPLARWLGGTLKQARLGETIFEFVVRPEMTNPAGILHGGAAAAIIDEALGATVHGTLNLDVFYTSVNLAIDFIGSARAGETIAAETRVVRQGKTIINAECWLRGADGRLLARATTNLLRTSVPIAAVAPRSASADAPRREESGRTP
ncbi:MAG: thioesterase [Chloracidobacterium sp. CP2_5A]|nr:MAG: thioesterase [Chloracidobacterium sp. CP2_5A]